MTEKQQIADLKKQLKRVKENIYVYETNTLHCSEGELHVGFGKDRWLVWNVDSLFKNLPSIVSMVTKENDKQQNMYGDLLRDSLKENER